MRTLLRFGNGSKLYTFPTRSQVTFTDDFDKMSNKIVRVAGVNGGYRNSGVGRGQSVGGTVKVDNWLTFNDYVEASDKLDSLRQMADWGLQPLWMQPLYGLPRFCFAALNSAPLQQDVHNTPHDRQKIQVTFDVPDPFWYTAGTEVLWGSGWKWGDGTKWGEGATAPAPTNISGSGSFSVTVAGTHFTFARLIINNDSGSPASDFIIRRIEGGKPADEVRWTGTLATGEQLHIDRRRSKVRRGPTGADVISSFSAINPDWMRLYPGTNAFQVYVNGASKVSVRWLERYV